MKMKNEKREKEVMGNEIDDDDRRETAIASTQPLRPNFNPKGVSQGQLSKLQELHRRRLQLKSKSKGTAFGTSKSHGKDVNSMDHDDSYASATMEDSSVSSLKSHNDSKHSSVQQDNVEAYLAPKKRQKLHWGLDTKERWEMKANM